MDDELDQLAATYQQVRYLQDMGRNDEALSLGLALLESSDRVLGAVNPDAAEVHATIGILARRLGRRDLAFKHQQRGLEIRIACFGDWHLAVAASLNNLGSLYLDAEDFLEAETCYRKALAIKEQSPDAGVLDVAFARNNLSSVISRRGNPAEAEQLLLRAVAEAGHADTADWRSVFIMSNLARTYRLNGRQADAVPVLEQAVEIADRVLPPGHYLLLEQCEILGQCLLELGCFGEATAALGRTAEGYLAQFGADDNRTVTAFSHLAEANRQAGFFGEAEAAAQRVLENTAPRSLPYAAALNTLALIHREMGLLTQAASEFQEAVGILQECANPDDPLLGLVLSNLAALLRQQKRYDASRSLFERAVAILRMTRHETLPMALNNYGVLALEMEDYASAEQLWRECIELYTGQAYPSRDINLAKLQNNLGELLSDQRRFADAEPLLREANERKRQLLGSTHPAAITGLANLARVYVATGRPEEALRLLTEADKLTEQTLWQVFARSPASGRREFMDQLLGYYDAVLTIVVACLPNSDDTAKAAFELVLRRKGLLAEAVLAHYSAAAGAGSQAILEQLFKVSGELSRAALTGGRTSGNDNSAALQAERDRLEALLAQKTGGGGLESILSTASPDAVAAALPAGGVLVEYARFQERNFDHSPWSQQAWGSERYAAFVMSQADARVHMVDLGEALPVDELLDEYRHALARGGEGIFGIERGPDQEEVEELGSRLRAAVFDPVAAHFPVSEKEARPLIVAPDGSLAKLPFAALPAVGGAQLLDDYVISYLPSGRKLVGRPQAGPIGPALVVGAPDFDLGVPAPQAGDPVGYLDDDLDDQSFPPLPASSMEGTLVAGLLGVEPFLGAAATGDLLTTARSPRIIHLATHAFFVPDETRYLDPRTGTLAVEVDLDSEAIQWAFAGKSGDEPFGASGVHHPGRLGQLGSQEALYRSGLVFSGANAWLRDVPLSGPAETAVLTADRIACLDLQATDLIVFSACETGLGDITREEGVLGLRWSCAVAGARSVLMSLWKIPDDETRQLMEKFYRDILNGASRAEALREAQLALRTVRPDPYYWGAFVLEGHVGPLA